MHTGLHLEKTRLWAQEVGFPAEAADAIARADADVDFHGLPRNLYHMRPPLLLGADLRRQTAEDHLEQAVFAATAGDCSVVWENLGRGLHALQDQVAHGPWWLFGIHWFRWLDDPTRTVFGLPDPQQRRLAAIERITKQYLVRALSEGCVKRCTR